MAVLQLRLNDNLSIKDPQSSELGEKIIKYSIPMIDQLGFEGFTFRKLSLEIESTEASIYRYFENKHRLLVYLISWYWAWLDYRIEFETHHLTEPEQKLKVAIRLITEKKIQDDTFPDIDEEALSRIVVSESDKIYLTKQVDENNREGLFRGYKSLCEKIANFVSEINCDYPYPHALVSTALEAAHQQIFFANHLPSLTELSLTEDPYQTNYDFIKSMIFSTIHT
ncbi:MAG: TetR/AcrR family transcriptional regulator [Bacteroidota bacterium]